MGGFELQMAYAQFLHQELKKQESLKQVLQQKMGRSELYPAMLEGELSLDDGDGLSPEGRIAFRFEVESFDHLRWTLDNCFVIKELPENIYATLAERGMRFGSMGNMDQHALWTFSWTLRTIETS